MPDQFASCTGAVTSVAELSSALATTQSNCAKFTAAIASIDIANIVDMHVLSTFINLLQVCGIEYVKSGLSDRFYPQSIPSKAPGTATVRTATDHAELLALAATYPCALCTGAICVCVSDIHFT